MYFGIVGIVVTGVVSPDNNKMEDIQLRTVVI